MKFVGFGEIMVRLAPDGYLRFPQVDHFNINYTGAEANMCVSLSYMGMDTEFVTRLPENDIADCAMRKMAMYGVDTSHVVRGGDRIGLYYLERGASQRPSKVIYDRKHTAISEARPEDFDWDEIFRDADWFHFTGITVPLGPRLGEICRQACVAAKEHGVKVSCDLNYRKALWTPEQAQQVMRPLMPYVDVLIANEEDVEKVLGVNAPDTDITAGKLSPEGYEQVARQLTEAYGFSAVGITMRGSISASVNEWSGLLYTGGKCYRSPKYTIQLVDRVGGGDSFASGLIYGFLHEFDAQKTLDFAVAASCLKQSIEYDFNLSTVEEVFRLMGGDGSGRVQR